MQATDLIEYVAVLLFEAMNALVKETNCGILGTYVYHGGSSTNESECAIDYLVPYALAQQMY